MEVKVIYLQIMEARGRIAKEAVVLGRGKSGKIVAYVGEHGRKPKACTGSVTIQADMTTVRSVQCRTCHKYNLNAVDDIATCSTCKNSFFYGTEVNACLCGEGRMWYVLKGEAHNTYIACSKGSYLTLDRL